MGFFIFYLILTSKAKANLVMLINILTMSEARYKIDAGFIEAEAFSKEKGCLLRVRLSLKDYSGSDIAFIIYFCTKFFKG